MGGPRHQSRRRQDSHRSARHHAGGRRRRALPARQRRRERCQPCRRRWLAAALGRVGKYPTGIDQASEAVAADFRVAPSVRSACRTFAAGKNRKLLTNLANAVEAVCGPQERQGPLGDMFLAEGETVLSAARSKRLLRRKTGTDEVISCSSARSQGRPGPVGPHGKACGALPAASRPTTSTARSWYSAGYMALRHQPTNCCNDSHGSLPSPRCPPVQLPQRRSWGDSKRPARQLTLGSFDEGSAANTRNPDHPRAGEARIVLVKLSLVEQRLDTARAVLADTATKVAVSVGVSRQDIAICLHDVMSS